MSGSSSNCSNVKSKHGNNEDESSDKDQRPPNPAAEAFLNRFAPRSLIASACRREGILLEVDFACCQTCARAEIKEIIRLKNNELVEDWNTHTKQKSKFLSRILWCVFVLLMYQIYNTNPLYNWKVTLCLFIVFLCMVKVRWRKRLYHFPSFVVQHVTPKPILISGYAFSHSQDVDNNVFQKQQENNDSTVALMMHLSYDAIHDPDLKSLEIGHKVVAILQEHDVMCEWNGQLDTNIIIYS